jgi:hypothetical protein
MDHLGAMEAHRGAMEAHPAAKGGGGGLPGAAEVHSVAVET